MNITQSGKSCNAYLKSQYQHSGNHLLNKKFDTGRSSITISRATGARGRSIAYMLADHLNKNKKPSHCKWTVFYKDLISNVLKKNNLPEDLEKFMPEEKVSEFVNTVEELLGLHPSLWELQHKTNKSILNLARLGNVIIVGRGGNLITRKINNVINIRFIGSINDRINRVVSCYNMSRDNAKSHIKKEDKKRADYIKQNFDTDINDPLNYDLTINTDKFSDNKVVNLISQVV